MPGVVEQAGNSADYGNFLLLNHGNGLESFYGHCETLTAKQGEDVREGEVIAKVGSTGQSTGFHLHFEIRINHVYVNPAWQLLQGGAAASV